MRHLKRLTAMMLAGAAAMAGITPRGSFNEMRVQQQGSQRSKDGVPLPAPAAKKGQLVSEQTLGGFSLRSAPGGAIWAGRPRGSYGDMFKRRKGQRWVGQ